MYQNLFPRNLIYALSFEKLEDRDFSGDIQIIFNRLKTIDNYCVEIKGDNNKYEVNIEKINLWYINCFKKYLNIVILKNGASYTILGKVIYKPIARIITIIYVIFGIIIGAQTGSVLVIFAFAIASVYLVSLLLKIIEYFVNDDMNFIFEQLIEYDKYK